MVIYKPNNEPQKYQLDADITIIGSGAGGAITAAKMSEQGYSVIVLEEGPYVDYNDFTQDERVLIPKMYRRSAGLATDDMSIRILQGRVYGGSTTINWMTSLRTPDFVLNEWIHDYGLNEYSSTKLEKHFDAIEERLNIHKVADDEHSPQNRIILDGSQALDIQHGSLPNNSKDCIGCGACGLGCYYDAKMDTRLTYLSDAQEHDTTIYTSTRAEKINYHTKNSQTVEATILGEEDYRLENKKLTINSKRTVVSAGAVYTPLILQHSGLTKSKALGKYFQIHPVTGAFAEFDREINPTYGIPQSAYSKEYIDYDGNGYGWWLEVPDLEPFLAGVNFPGLGEPRREGMENLQNSGVIIILVRDGANKKSNGEVKWSRGLNMQNGHLGWKKIPSIRYKLSDTDKHHLLKGLENAVEVHLAAGAKRVLTLHAQHTEITDPSQSSIIFDRRNGPGEISIFSAHPMGTARMGTDKSVSVVDQTMQMHHYPGVYVMDGSILPTALGVNPMETIFATISRAIELGNLDL